jgi:hypothetical protein
MTKLSPTVDEIEAMRSDVPPGPVIMVNLVKFKPGGGKDSYGKYIKTASLAATQCGTAIEILYAGKAGKDVAAGDQWDMVILARYPSFDAFADFVSHPIYQDEAIPLRTIGLEKALFMVSQPIDLVAEFDLPGVPGRSDK